jgi:hypothetical protein
LEILTLGDYSLALNKIEFGDIDRIFPLWICDKCAVGECIVASAGSVIIKDKCVQNGEMFKPNNNCPLGSGSINYADFFEAKEHDLIIVPKEKQGNVRTSTNKESTKFSTVESNNICNYCVDFENGKCKTDFGCDFEPNGFVGRELLTFL